MNDGSARFRSIATLFVLGHIVAALSTLAAAAPLELNAIPSGDFESAEGSTPAESIPGWTTYGAPSSVMAVVDAPECSDGRALWLSRGKAFCYEVPLRPETDYVLKVRVRAHTATVRIELDAATGVEPVQADSATTFNWKTVHIALPATARRHNTTTMWIALAVQAASPGGAAWFDDVRLEPDTGGLDTVPNGSFAEPVLKIINLPGWVQHSGAADVRLDREVRKEGQSSLRIRGLSRPVKIVHTVDLKAAIARGVRRIRISAWGKCSGLAMESVKLVVSNAGIPLPPVLCMTGNQDWTRGHVVFDPTKAGNGAVTLTIEATQSLSGQAWFDSLRADEVPEGETVNLLWNSGFHQATTNPHLPDFWGVYGSATLCIDPWSYDYFGIDDREASPVIGTRVLRMQNPRRDGVDRGQPADRATFFVLHGGDFPASTQAATFSVYVKAATAGTKIEFRHPAAQAGQARTIGTAWERIALSGSNSQQMACLFLPMPGSLVWMAAPQLEQGTDATAYTPAQGQISRSIEVVRAPSDGAAVTLPTIRNVAAIPWQAGRQPVEAFAEYDVYTDEARGRGRIRWTKQGPGEVVGRLLDATSGEVLAPRLFTLKAEAPTEATFEFDIAALRPGRFMIQTVALENGKKVGRSLDGFSVAPNAQHPVRSSRTTRSLIVDGRPFFPLFLPMEPAQLSDRQLQRLAEAGFNTLIGAPVQLSYADTARTGLAPRAETAVRNQLARLSRFGMKLVWPLSWSFKDWNDLGTQHRGDISSFSSAIRQIVRRFHDHPAIIGWYIVDEPSAATWEMQFGFRESDLTALHDIVKTEDPSRPCYVNWNHSWAFAPYGGLSCTDLISHDNYALSDAPFDLAALVPTVRMLNDERAARKPAFAWISGSYDELKFRPNADAVRVHAWLHIVYGTRGLGYWSRPPLDPDVWAEIRSINSDVTRLHTDVFGRRDAQLLATSHTGSGLHYVTWLVADRAVVLGVNTKSSAAEIRLDMRRLFGTKPVGTRRLFTRDTETGADPGMLTDTIPAWQRFGYDVQLP